MLESHMPVIRTNSPEVQALLDNEEKWDFDIIQLERLTNNRWLDLLLYWPIYTHFNTREQAVS